MCRPARSRRAPLKIPDHQVPRLRQRNRLRHNRRRALPRTRPPLLSHRAKPRRHLNHLRPLRPPMRMPPGITTLAALSRTALRRTKWRAHRRLAARPRSLQARISRSLSTRRLQRCRNSRARHSMSHPTPGHRQTRQRVHHWYRRGTCCCHPCRRRRAGFLHQAAFPSDAACRRSRRFPV